MKVSVNWTKQFLDFELPAVDELVEKIGAQLGAVEEVVDIGARYKGAVVAKVVSCEQHPNADKLKVCLIDDGNATADVTRNADGLVQVVCGAPNVATGQLVAWLPPGSTVPESYGKDPFVLEARELRGVVSNGMLGSAKELAIGDSHEGILVIDKEVVPGEPFVNVYKLDDYIIDIENKMFTHRPDCFGVLGVAREIAGILREPFKSPEWYQTNPQFPASEGQELGLEVRNELPELVPRFTAITLRDVAVGPSPVWLQAALSKVGQKPINNIVDLTNFYMLVTGQPLHAYDYDKVKALSDGDGATIVVRFPKQGEKIKLLNGKEIAPRQEAIMIATDKQAIGIGGVMGGADTEVDANTKNIILESANFDMYSIRRTSMAHGLFTDAVTRFNKGQSPLQNLAVLAKITNDVAKLAGGKVASALIDNDHYDHEAKAVALTAEFINARLGLNLSSEEVTSLLENVEFGVVVTGENLEITAPFWRTDIETPEDIVEEVGRLYGYDHLPLELPQRSITPVDKDPMLELKSRIRENLVKSGANEVLTYSFVHGNLLDKVGQDKAQAFQLSNALSPDLQYYRLSLTPSLLEKVHSNIKAGYEQFMLFELGKVHGISETDAEDLPAEFDRVAGVFAADKKAAQHYAGAPYYQVRTYVMNLFSGSGMAGEVTARPLHEVSFDGHELIAQMTAPFAPERSAGLYKDDAIIGVVGEYKAAVRRALKLPDFSAGFELFVSAFSEQAANSYVALPKFPKVMQDITFKVPVGLPYQELCNFVWTELGKMQPDNTLPVLGPIDIYQSETDATHKHITLRLTIASYEKTMRDEEVAKLLGAVGQAVVEKYGAEVL